jgi:hypothetical protein
MMITPMEHPETDSFNWEYTGGCYQGGAIAAYEDAIIGEEYDFSKIPMEVREDESITTALASNVKETTFYFTALIGWMSSLMFFIGACLTAYFIFLYAVGWNSMRAGSKA